MTTKNKNKPKVGITIGDINGIGPEVIIKVFRDNRICSMCTPIIYGSGKVLTKYKRLLEIEDFSYHQYNTNSYLNEKKTNLINCWQDQPEIEPGKVTEQAGQLAFLALEKAVKDLKAEFIEAVVTAPINKANVQNEQFSFPGHTEYFANMFDSPQHLMMMCSEQLKLAVATGHIPLAKVPEQLTREVLTLKLEVLINALKNDFQINRPKVAVLGLNPHAGEGGLLGEQEREVIEPVVAELRNKGNLVYGPYPADGFFGAMLYRKFDGVMAMYHDQGLTPFKLLAFENGVNYTAGLPIVRTSPDHGTGYDIAGKGLADESSLRHAVYTAVELVKNRKDVTPYKIRDKEISKMVEK